MNRLAEVGQVLYINLGNSAAIDAFVATGGLNTRDLCFPLTSQAYGSGKTILQNNLGRKWTEAAMDPGGAVAQQLAVLYPEISLEEWKAALRATLGARTVDVKCSYTAEKTIQATTWAINKQFGFATAPRTYTDEDFKTALEMARRIAPVILCWDELGEFGKGSTCLMAMGQVMRHMLAWFSRSSDTTGLPTFCSPTLRRMVGRLSWFEAATMTKARAEFSELRSVFMTALEATAAAPGEQGVHPVYCLVAGRLSLPLSLMFCENQSSSPYTNQSIALQALKVHDIEELIGSSTYLPALSGDGRKLQRMELARLLREACAGVPRAIHWVLSVISVTSMDVSTPAAMQVAVQRIVRMLATGSKSGILEGRTLPSPADAELFDKLILCDMFDIALDTKVLARGDDTVAGDASTAAWADQQRELLAVSTYLPVMFDPAPDGLKIPRVATMLRTLSATLEDPLKMPEWLLYAGLPREKDVCLAVIRGGLRYVRGAEACPGLTMPLRELVPFLPAALGGRLIWARALQLRPCEVSAGMAPFSLAAQARIPADLAEVKRVFFPHASMHEFDAALARGRLPWHANPANCDKVLTVVPMALAPSADVFVLIPRTAWAVNGVAPPPPVLFEIQVKGSATLSPGAKAIGRTVVVNEVCKSLLFDEDTPADAQVVLVIVADTLDAALAPGVCSVLGDMAKLLAADKVAAFVKRKLGSRKVTQAASEAEVTAALARLTVVVADPIEFRKWAPRRVGSDYSGKGSDTVNPVPVVTLDEPADGQTTKKKKKK